MATLSLCNFNKSSPNLLCTSNVAQSSPNNRLKQEWCRLILIVHCLWVLLQTEINQKRILLNLQLQACISHNVKIKMLLLTDLLPKSIGGPPEPP